MDSKLRAMDAKPARKEAENKRLAKFFAADRPPRKRLRTLLDFLKAPPGAAGTDGAGGNNIAVAVQSLLSGAPKDAAVASQEHAAAVEEFWADAGNSAMLFSVVNDCVTELENLYTPHETAFRKMRKKPLEAEDWSEVFEGLEVLIRNNVPLIHEGWNNNGLTMLFMKLLKRDNHAMIKKYAFRCLALYTDATRNLQQLAAMSSSPTTVLSATRAGSIVLGSDGDLDIDDEDATTSGRGTAVLGHANKRKNLHLDLLRESVDFSPYGGGSILLPDKFMNEGVHVEGWMRPNPTQAEEPVDMLKFIMDLSLERDDPKLLSHPNMNHRARGDRFVFWAELIMKFYMPLLYPKVCLKTRLKEEGDTLGFFHHCPGSFQRVVARWVYKFRSKDDFMEVVWSRREFSEVIMETIRQRFAYRDSELVLDAIKFYSGICNGSQYIPAGMKTQMNECSRAMISHVSQLFHPSVQLDDTKLLLHCIELLELVSQRKLDDYTSTYLRKFVISTIDNCSMLRDPTNISALSAMLSVVIHVWMHAAVSSKATGPQVWLELTIAIRRWIVSPNDAKVVGPEIINCWKRELRFASCLLMYVMDKGYSYLKVTPEGSTILPQSAAASQQEGKSLKELKQGYIQSAANFMMMAVLDVGDATLLLDRVLHLIPPSTVAALPPFLHFSMIEGFLELIELWIDGAICSPRTTPTELSLISPSTVIALFGEWFLPACELESPDFQNSRCLAIVTLCKLCSARCVNSVTQSHLTVLARVLFKGITSPSGVVVSTVLQKSASIFTLNLQGLNVLVPAYLYAVDQIIIQNIWERAEQSRGKSSNWNKELNAALDVVFSVLSLPKRFPNEDFVRWTQKLQRVCDERELALMSEIIDEVPDSLDSFYVIVGRVLVRIAGLPFADIVDIKKRALWGLYSLVVMNLKTQEGSRPVDHIHMSEWIVHLIDVCQDVDVPISTAALTILQDMADYHEEINAFEPSIVARIVMTLAVFAQQQVEDASMEVQSAVEKLGPQDSGVLRSITGGDRLGSSISGSRISSDKPARRSSDNRSSRLEAPSEVNDPFSKLKNKLKPSASTPPTSLSTPTTPNAGPSAPASANAIREHDIPALRLIVQKTSAIFECLRFWIMHRPEILHDPDVKKLVFSAIEAALVGTLPDGEWQNEVERARTHERRMSMPLLFLGLQMRASLDNEISQSWLKYFEETAVAAEGLLMHLLHHINGFPSPAGVDQMISNCSELTETENTDDGSSNGDGSLDKSSPASLSFVFMDSIVFTVVGSLDSPCARFIARDMTGLFTWEITPAVPRVSSSTSFRGSLASSLASKPSIVERELTVQSDLVGSNSLVLYRPECAVQVEFKSTDNDKPVVCDTCGGEKQVNKLSELEGLSTARLQTAQIAWERERDIMSNSVCPVKSTYVFHEDSSASGNANGSADKRKNGDKAKSSEVEKMPTSGNKDERQERLEKIARQYEERNNLVAPQSPPSSSSSKKECDCDEPSELFGPPARKVTTICGLFDMDMEEPNIGSLDDERSLLDLVLDSIPMVFRDCGGDTTDKTLLGGRYTMVRYNLMDRGGDTSPLLKDPSDMPGCSFLQRLIHDEECYSQLKTFLSKEDNAIGKELLEFCDAVRKYERSMTPSDRLGQASVIFWEYFCTEGGKKFFFPPIITANIQAQINEAQRVLRLPEEGDQRCLSGSLFQDAIGYLESSVFESSGLIDKYVAALDQIPNGSTSGKEGSGGSVPPQLSLFDSFSIMELNSRISHLALQKRNLDDQLSSMTKPGMMNGEKLIDPASSVRDSRVSALDICRLFLSQAGLLPAPNGDVGHHFKLKLLENGSKLERSLRHLDKSPTRETMKIGVIYVGKNQRSQQEILRNEKGSTAYNQFMTQLGWEIDMKKHRGFVGGLDTNPKSMSNGESTLYYANSHSEVIFHVVTMMPTKAADAQQIDKKRHVGNDYVHIVWSDNTTHDYVPSTITSHFNDVQIVIYPLQKAQKGLFLVRIHSKDKVPPFGPLQSGMVVHRADLARLVRQTAMNANRVCRSQVSACLFCVHSFVSLFLMMLFDCPQTSLYVRPYPTRKKLVDEIVERYAVEYKESQLLTMLFASSSAASTASAAASLFGTSSGPNGATASD